MPKVVLDLQREQWTNTAQINHDEISDSACRTSGLCVSAPPSVAGLSLREPPRAFWRPVSAMRRRLQAVLQMSSEWHKGFNRHCRGTSLSNKWRCWELVISKYINTLGNVIVIILIHNKHDFNIHNNRRNSRHKEKKISAKRLKSVKSSFQHQTVWFQAREYAEAIMLWCFKWWWKKWRRFREEPVHLFDQKMLWCTLPLERTLVPLPSPTSSP